MTTSAAPVVRSFEPARHMERVMKVGNAILRRLLRTGAGARMGELALITVTGRKTGTHYEIPVSVLPFEGHEVVLTAGRWRVNLRGGAEVQVRRGHEERTLHAELVDEPVEVARVYEALLQRVGLKNSKRVGLRVSGDRMPTEQELADAIGHERTVVVLTPT
jgi:hypothetical protein